MGSERFELVDRRVRDGGRGWCDRGRAGAGDRRSGWRASRTRTVADAQRAAAAAQRAFRSGPWPRIRAVERAKALRALAARIREQATSPRDPRSAQRGQADRRRRVGDRGRRAVLRVLRGRCHDALGPRPARRRRRPLARAAPTGRPLRADRPVELPVPDRRLEGGARPGGRKHRRAEARERDALHARCGSVHSRAPRAFPTACST